MRIATSLFSLLFFLALLFRALTADIAAAEVEHPIALKSAIKSNIHRANALRKTLRGAIYAITSSRHISIGPPNMFGSTIKVGIPSPTGSLSINSPTPPAKEQLLYLANDINKGVTALAKDGDHIWDLHFADGQLQIALNKSTRALDEIKNHNKNVQTIVNAADYDRRKSSILVGKEVLAMSDSLDDLSDSLKAALDSVDNRTTPEPKWGIASRQHNWK